jgi:hypothetical protein
MGTDQSTRKPKYKDRVGERFDRLCVVRYHGPDSVGDAVWWCRCDCGNELAVRVKSLKTANTRSCGCLRKEVTAARGTTHGRTRGRKQPAEYRAWSHVIQRCTNPDNKDFKHYGGRGIQICDRWRKSFEAFLADMGERPSKYHTLDRFPNNDGNYEPGNCRWATQSEQMNNTRVNTLISCDGRTQTLQQWCDEVGISPSLLCQRLGRLKWPVEEALGFTPHVNRNKTLTPAEKKLRVQARNAVNKAVIAGILPRVTTLHCGKCGAQAESYHHHNGYDPAHRLDVVPLCNKCHGKR